MDIRPDPIGGLAPHDVVGFPPVLCSKCFGWSADGSTWTWCPCCDFDKSIPTLLYQVV